MTKGIEMAAITGQIRLFLIAARVRKDETNSVTGDPGQTIPESSSFYAIMRKDGLGFPICQIRDLSIQPMYTKLALPKNNTKGPPGLGEAG